MAAGNAEAIGDFLDGHQPVAIGLQIDQDTQRVIRMLGNVHGKGKKTANECKAVYVGGFLLSRGLALLSRRLFPLSWVFCNSFCSVA